MDTKTQDFNIFIDACIMWLKKGWKNEWERIAKTPLWIERGYQKKVLGSRINEESPPKLHELLV